MAEGDVLATYGPLFSSGAARTAAVLDDTYALVSHNGSTQGIKKLNYQTGTVDGTLSPAPTDSRGIVFADGKIYAAHSANQVYVYDQSTFAYITAISLSGAGYPWGGCVGLGAMQGHVYFTGYPGVYEISTSSNTVTTSWTASGAAGCCAYGNYVYAIGLSMPLTRYDSGGGSAAINGAPSPNWPMDCCGYNDVLYVNNYSGGTVNRYNLQTQQWLTAVTGFSTNGPSEILAGLPGSNRVYVMDSTYVRFINTQTGTVTLSVGLGTAGWGFGLSPDGTRIVATAGGSVKVIDTGYTGPAPATTSFFNMF